MEGIGAWPGECLQCSRRTPVLVGFRVASVLMNSKELTVEEAAEAQDSVKRRILLRAAAKKANTTPQFLPSGDAEATELITALRRISLTPPRSAPKPQPSESAVREKLYQSLQTVAEDTVPLTPEPPPKCPVTPLPRMKHAGPKLKQTEVSTYRPPPDTDLSQAVSTVASAAQRLTARQIDELKDNTTLPTTEEMGISGAFLALFAEIDSRIDVTPSFQVMQSCSWETLQSYAQQPGHVIRMMRNIPELVLSGRVSDLAIQRSKALLKAPNSASHPIWRVFYDFIVGTIELYEVKKSVGRGRVQTYLKSRSTSRTPLTSNQSTMRTMDESLPNISISLLSGEYFNSDSFKRDTPSPRDKENSPMNTHFTPTHKGKGTQYGHVREIQWKLDDLLREFLRNKMTFSPKGFMRDLGENKQEILGEFEERAMSLAMSAEMQTQAVLPFLKTLGQGNVLEEVVRVMLLLCPAPPSAN